MGMIQIMVEHDVYFTRVQEQYQEQYTKLCQMLKKAQRYPVGGLKSSISGPTLAPLSSHMMT